MNKRDLNPQGNLLQLLVTKSTWKRFYSNLCYQTLKIGKLEHMEPKGKGELGFNKVMQKREIFQTHLPNLGHWFKVYGIILV